MRVKCGCCKNLYRYEHKKIWPICLLITHTFFQCPARHQNSLCLCYKGAAVQSSRGDGKLWQEKKEAEGIIYTLLKTNHHKQRVRLIGKASLQHWFDATLAWKCSCNCLTQPCHEFGQESCGAFESKSDSCADDGPAAPRNSKRDTVADSFSNNNIVITIGWGRVGVFMLRWPGEWLNVSGWPSAITTAGIVLQNLS